MAKKLNSDEILKMAVGLLPSDPSADLDGDGKISASDARQAARGEVKDSFSESVSLMAENTINKILHDSSNYSYDVNEDSLYQQYKDMYEKEGSLAAEDIMGKASSLTGGYGNSYGSVIASDTKRRYSEMSADKASELEEKAYKRHQDSISNLYSVYNVLADYEKSEADKKKAALDFAVTAANMGDTSFIEALGIDPSDSDFKKLQEKAEFYAKYGDYSALEKLGVDVSALEDESEMKYAELLAKYGDFSALRAYGVNTDEAEKKQMLEFGELLAKYGDYSVLEEMGLDTSRLSEEEKRELADFYAKYGDYSALSDAGVDISKLQAQERRDFFEYYMKLGMDIGDFYAKYGDYSGLEMLGIDVSKLGRDEQLKLAELYAKYGDYSLLKKLGVNTADKELEEYYDRLLKKQKVW